jgi:ribonuclease HI
MEEIRKRVSTMERLNWTIEFSWVKAHTGINSKELADRLAKKAARSRDRAVAFTRIPKNTLYSEREDEAKKFQNEWETCTKTAVVVTSSVILQLVT